MSRVCQNCSTENRDTSRYCSKCGTAIFLTEEFRDVNTVIAGRYKLVRLIKIGGMGAIYETIDEHFGDKCALKVMTPKYSSCKGQEYLKKRFEEEAKMLRKLHHPNLPRVIDYFIEDGIYYLVMDFIEGKDLETILNSNGTPGLPEEKLTDWAIQVLDVLSYLHSQKPPIIYRDLKPGNIMLRENDDKVFLVDFGIARTMIIDNDALHTVIGTQGYAPPEQYKGHIEPRSDLYAMGATLHHLCTGKSPLVPFQFEPVQEFVSNISENFVSVIMKALSAKPEDRFFNAEEMKNALINNKKRNVSSGGGKREGKIGRLLSGIIGNITVREKRTAPIELPQDIVAKSVLVTPSQLSVTPSQEEMILIPPGESIMGSKETLGFLGSRWQVMPVYKLYLDAYYIDIYPVSNEEYEKFIQETGYKSDGTWRKYYNPLTSKHPVVNVSWNDASAYASWKGKRLPTQAEWEKAARGTDFRTYPWGQEWDKNKCNNLKMDRIDLLGKISIMEQGRGTLPVDSFPEGKSTYGVMDMIGNVWEWCSDWYYKPEGIQINPKGPSDGTFKVLCGGAWNLQDMYCFWCATRTKDKPDSYNNQTGFRCAKSA
ncbi:MAG TPA: SUMF1/EgtB/PvdO family nonheme iron enzyme [Candidatus Eremiobacteraeota bacterium]|mgnify:CR=1 FL=1|nr:SUMF1/EgtB/PvdO family nonheme iron enzyme [Candidatus Eremiobacteraeota bacterium]